MGDRPGKVNPLKVTLLLFVAAAIPFLFVSGPEWLNTLPGRAFTNFFHLPFFAAITYLVHQMVGLPPTARNLVTVTIVGGIGVAIELIQSKIGREASLKDLYLDMLGCLTILLYLQTPSLTVWFGRIAVFVLDVLQLGLFLRILYYALLSINMFPLLADFENDWELSHWNGNIQITPKHATRGNHSLQLDLSRGPYPGIVFSEMPGNWLGFTYLRFDVHNSTASPIRMNLRIEDNNHNQNYFDRYNRELVIQPGLNAISIDLSDVQSAPTTRLMHLDKVKAVVLFSLKPEPEYLLYTDNWRLE
jgi:hypothetical protein